MSGGDPRAKKLTSSRFVAIAAIVGVSLGVLFSVAAGGDDGDSYLVRAVFDNGSFVIPGEDVKIAGVKVGAIHDVDLTEENQAAVVLKIDDPAFVPFRKDAQCQIRLQSLIGEQFIECKPTRPIKDGQEPAPELARVESGRGEGQYLLPADNNITPVGEDLLRNINRMPQREGWRLIINELGAGLAGNGDRLRAAVRRANPALKEFDRFAQVLADQDRLLGRLIDHSDTVLSAWVQKRKQTAGFIDEAGATAAAAAERGDDIERNFQRFPAFLRELKPTADRFSGLADQMTPALNSLDSQAKAINSMVEGTGPFFEAATPALVSLGDFADRARTLFPAMRPLIADLDRLGKPMTPATTDLANLFGSFDDSGGIEELMKLIYFYTGTINGVDAQGHYVRSSLVFNGSCATRTGDFADVARPTPQNCGSTLGQYATAASAAATLAGQPQSAEDLKRSVAPATSIAGFPLDDEEVAPVLDYLFGKGGGK